MASIMKRGNTYSVRYNYKDHAGKPCKGWETFKTKAEAQERKITVEKELLDGTFLVPDTMTVEEMLYKWIPIQSSKHKWSPKTYTQSVAMVQNLIVPYIGKRKVQDLRTYDIEQFYATLSQTPCGQYVHGEKQELTENQKKRLLSSTSIHEVHTLLKTAFSYAVDWDLIHKSPTPREAPKINTEERTIWDERTMLAALQTIENPALHLAVHMSMILSLREGEILGLQPGDLDFDAADGRGTISVNKALQRADKVALSKIDPTQIYHTFPDRREGSKSSLILKRTKTKKSNRILYMTKPLKEELLAWLEKMKQDEQSAPEKYSNCGQLFRLPDGLPIAPDDGVEQYGDGSLGACLGNETFQVGIERTATGIGMPLGIGLFVVVAELDKDVIALLQQRKHLVPPAFVDETLGAASVHGMIVHPYLFGQKSRQHLSPSSFGVAAGQVLVGHGRIANHKNGDCWLVGFERRKDQKQGQQQNQFVFHIILFLQFLGSYLFGRGRFQPSPASRFRDTCTARERHLYGSRATQVWNTSRASVAHIPRQKASEGGLEPYFCASEGVHVRHWLKM